MLPSVVSPPTCSSPTSSAKTSERKTPVSLSVCFKQRDEKNSSRRSIPSNPDPPILSIPLDPKLYLTRILIAGQVGKVLGERWKALNEKQRAPYEAKAAADKKRYEDEKASYNVCLYSSPRPRINVPIALAATTTTPFPPRFPYPLMPISECADKTPAQGTG